MRIDILGVGFDNLTMTEAVARGCELLAGEGAHYVVCLLYTSDAADD